MNSKVLRALSYGVYVVGTMDGERPTGCVANSSMQITSSPATIAVSVNHDNYTNGCMKKSGVFSLNIMSEQAEPSVIGTFGYSSGKDTDKFAQVPYEMVAGVPVLKESCGYVVCKIVNQMETATHTVFLGEVVEAEVLNDQKPMTYAYYHEVIKGKSPKNAPTYIPEEEETKAEDVPVKKYVCKICGYVYEGETLPDDYKCPICGMGADKFELQE